MRSETSRSAFLHGIAVAPLLLAALPSAARADDQKVPQSAVQYQDKPNGDKRCAKCASFIPGPSDGNGTCKIVSGAISPNGYCIAFS
jgi:hypothetical protein